MRLPQLPNTPLVCSRVGSRPRPNLGSGADRARPSPLIPLAARAPLKRTHRDEPHRHPGERHGCIRREGQKKRAEHEAGAPARRGNAPGSGEGTAPARGSTSRGTSQSTSAACPREAPVSQLRGRGSGRPGRSRLGAWAPGARSALVSPWRRSPNATTSGSHSRERATFARTPHPSRRRLTQAVPRLIPATIQKSQRSPATTETARGRSPLVARLDPARPSLDGLMSRRQNEHE